MLLGLLALLFDMFASIFVIAGIIAAIFVIPASVVYTVVSITDINVTLVAGIIMGFVVWRGFVALERWRTPVENVEREWIFDGETDE